MPSYKSTTPRPAAARPSACPRHHALAHLHSLEPFPSPPAPGHSPSVPDGLPGLPSPRGALDCCSHIHTNPPPEGIAPIHANT